MSSLAARGLASMRVVTSDACEGLVAAVHSALPGATSRATWPRPPRRGSGPGCAVSSPRCEL
ncbi:transposase [Atopobium sp. oral taxon 416]|nr:transposase [Atopobium sp. oral taxon 416]